MYNTASNFSGVKDWELKIGDTMNGPWADLANGTLPDPRLTRWNVPLAITSISGYDIPNVDSTILSTLDIPAGQVSK